jgi:hypothetical protein
MIGLPSNYNQIFPYFNEYLCTGSIHEIKDKFFFKALLKYEILYYHNIEDHSKGSPLIFFSYYFMDRDKPLITKIREFKNANMQVHVSPGDKLLSCFTNHVISLRIKTNSTIWGYDEIFRLIHIHKEVLSSYEIFVLFCFIVQNYLFTFDYWEGFVSKLKYFEPMVIKDKFYVTSIPSIVFFLYTVNLILSKFLLSTRYYSIHTFPFYSWYWFTLTIQFFFFLFPYD